jgi:hypothetical protein
MKSPTTRSQRRGARDPRDDRVLLHRKRRQLQELQKGAALDEKFARIAGAGDEGSSREAGAAGSIDAGLDRRFLAQSHDRGRPSFPSLPAPVTSIDRWRTLRPVKISDRDGDIVSVSIPVAKPGVI